MNGIIKKLLTWLILPAIIVLLVIAIVKSVMKPVEFNKEQQFREVEAIQRLKDIRTLQVAFKSVNGRYSPCIDSLVDLYNNGSMKILMQVGSMDDSLAVAHTEEVKKKNRGIKPEQLFKMYQDGDKDLVFAVENLIPVKDTLFNDRPDFCIDSLRTIPYSGGIPVIIESDLRMVSGVPVPLFEARMPYRELLKGMDNQLRINLDAERTAQSRFAGLQVGSVTAPNNNAGNWE